MPIGVSKNLRNQHPLSSKCISHPDSGAAQKNKGNMASPAHVFPCCVFRQRLRVGAPSAGVRLAWMRKFPPR